MFVFVSHDFTLFDLEKFFLLIFIKNLFYIIIIIIYYYIGAVAIEKWDISDKAEEYPKVIRLQKLVDSTEKVCDKV